MTWHDIKWFFSFMIVAVLSFVRLVIDLLYKSQYPRIKIKEILFGAVCFSESGDISWLTYISANWISVCLSNAYVSLSYWLIRNLIIISVKSNCNNCCTLVLIWPPTPFGLPCIFSLNWFKTWLTGPIIQLNKNDVVQNSLFFVWAKSFKR